MITSDAIVIDRLSKSFIRPDGSSLLVLDDISFQVEPGEFVSVVGPSGSGKSTVLNILSGLDPDYAGTARLTSDPNVRFSYVFQEPRLLPWRTVRRNIYFAMQCADVPKDEWEDRCDQQLAQVGLSGFADSYPHQLSGGMQQRASIARALVSEPAVLLMDEPFSGLDEFTGRRLRELLRQIWHGSSRSVIFVTHNVFEAAFLSDRIVVLSRGPARIHAEVPVDLPHPRDYDDPRVFEVSSSVVNEILSMTDPTDSVEAQL